MTQRPFEIPAWAPVAVLAALLVWAASMWWMVANLETGADPAVRQGVNALRDDMDGLASQVATLTDEIEGLQQERAALFERLEAVEHDALVAAVAVQEAAEAEAAAAAADEAVEEHPLFTAGKDRYNCLHFSSFEEAQDALRVNGPGDPNRIDSNGNGVACEDFTYRAPAASVSGPAGP